MNNAERTELIQYRINRSLHTLQEVNILIENQLWSTAINRLYYACYYAVLAILLKNNINPQTHAGTRQMFGLHFIKTGIISSDLGKFYSDIFDKRLTGDYDDFILMKEEDVIGLVPSGKELILKIKELIDALTRIASFLELHKL